MLNLDAPVQHTIELQVDGQINLPNSICQTLNWNPGDRLVLTLETDGNLRLNRLQAQIQKLQGIFKDLAPGVSLADELISDRRQAAKQEG
jgi:bifunctional DNA-binding transcriptional regulator/antitoxin component of YhaV-PrlF toxin-antitoxin module